MDFSFNNKLRLNPLFELLNVQSVHYTIGSFYSKALMLTATVVLFFPRENQLIPLASV